MVDTAFQPNAFQNNAFQIGEDVTPPPIAFGRPARPRLRPGVRPNDDDEVLTIILAALTAITERRH